MRKLPFLFTVLMFAGCDFDYGRVLASDVGLVVLADKPIAITQKAIDFTPDEKVKILGEQTSVCMVLKSDVSLRDPKTMNKMMKDAMQKANVKVDLTLTKGEHIIFNNPLPNWSLHGKVVAKNEFSACISPPCKNDLPIGAVVKKVEISSTAQIGVMGVYWRSEKDPSVRPVTKPVQKADKNCRT
jgi:hypothetical protein